MSTPIRPRTDKPHLGLTKAAFTILLDALAELRRRVLNGHVQLSEHPNLGICFHWQELLPDPDWDEAYTVLTHLAKGWKHAVYPGSTNPVPWVSGSHKWEGPNLAMRLNLMTYMRKRLRDLRRRAPDEART